MTATKARPIEVRIPIDIGKKLGSFAINDGRTRTLAALLLNEMRDALAAGEASGTIEPHGAYHVMKLWTA